MKIIYVENVRIPSERAHAYQIAQTCAWFARFGHEVVLVNPDRSKWPDVLPFYGWEQGLFKHVKLRSPDPLALKWMPRKIAYLLQRFFFTKALRKWVHGQEANVWYTRDPAMIDILKDHRRRFVLELHDDPANRPARWERIKAHVAKYVVITRGLQERLIALGVPASLIRVAPDGYDPKDFEHPGDRLAERQLLNLPEDAFVAIYIGGFYPWKGVDLVVQAWRKTDQNAHLVLIGGPEGDRRRLESFVPTEAAKRIHIVPLMEHARAVRALAAADVGLLTSSERQEIGRVYTSPLKQFEYLAAGLPVIASDVPSSHEVLTVDVAKFYPPTPEGFLETIAAAMKDEAWRARARELAPVLVAPYTWQVRAEKIAEALKQAL